MTLLTRNLQIVKTNKTC